MRQRDLYEAAFYNALTKYDAAREAGVYPKTARNAFADALLKAGDRYALDALQLRQRQAATTADIDAALEQIRANARTHEDQAEVLRQARTDIGRQDTYGTKAAS